MAPAWELYLHYVDLLERINVWALKIDSGLYSHVYYRDCLQRDRVSYLYHIADLESSSCGSWGWAVTRDSHHTREPCPASINWVPRKPAGISQILGVGVPQTLLRPFPPGLGCSMPPPAPDSPSGSVFLERLLCLCQCTRLSGYPPCLLLSQCLSHGSAPQRVKS